MRGVFCAGEGASVKNRAKRSEQPMSSQTQPHRLRELRNKALRYINVNGADKPKGRVPISDLKTHFVGLTEEEWKSLITLLYNERLAVTDGMNEHISLTDKGLQG
jgi:hypothetical protein